MEGLENKVGKLIVLDGTDGSGKQTQSKLLIERLNKEGLNAKYFEFPRHTHPHASLVDDYLTGKFGQLTDVSAYQASVLFAVDRYGSSFDIRQWMNEGGIAVCDRYVSANMGHQAGKIHDLEKRDAFLDWLDYFEYGLMNIPRPNLNMLLFVPTDISKGLVKKKDERAYLAGGKVDIHENDTQHQNDAARAFLYVAKKYLWPVIECTKYDGELESKVILSREDIHDKVWEQVSMTRKVWEEPRYWELESEREAKRREMYKTKFGFHKQ